MPKKGADDDDEGFLETKSNHDRMKNTEVEKIPFRSASVGQLGRSKISRSHLKKKISPKSDEKCRSLNFWHSWKIKKISKIRQN